MGNAGGGGKKRLDCFLPGMITIDGRRGRYPAISITGDSCDLDCLHCRGSLLRPMIPARTPEELKLALERLEAKGMTGALISGGCDANGRMPWAQFLRALGDTTTSLFLSCHGGLNVDKKIASAMKSSCISQVLIDVVGDSTTLREIYRLGEYGIMERTLYNVFSFGPEVIPHVIVGIHRGHIRGEYDALRLLAPYKPRLVVLVVLMPQILGSSPPSLDEVVEVFRAARAMFPEVSLGCARPRGTYRYNLERQLLEEGLISRLALWSDGAIETARKRGYEIRYRHTCCSLSD